MYRVEWNNQKVWFDSFDDVRELVENIYRNWKFDVFIEEGNLLYWSNYRVDEEEC